MKGGSAVLEEVTTSGINNQSSIDKQEGRGFVLMSETPVLCGNSAAAIL